MACLLIIYPLLISRQPDFLLDLPYLLLLASNPFILLATALLKVGYHPPLKLLVQATTLLKVGCHPLLKLLAFILLPKLPLILQLPPTCKDQWEEEHQVYLIHPCMPLELQFLCLVLRKLIIIWNHRDHKVCSYIAL